MNTPRPIDPATTGPGRNLVAFALPSRSVSLAAAAMGAIFLLTFSPGCITNKKWNPAATQPATVGDPAAIEPEYWLSRPPTEEVTGRDFTTLFETAEQVARARFFLIDTRDYRSGRLTTKPLVSEQWFEPWRRDVHSFDDVRESSLGPIRRTIHFEFDQNPDGSYTVAPKVLVERFSKVDVRYRYEYAQANLPANYWYPIRRDRAFEAELAGSIRRRLAAADAGPAEPAEGAL